MRLNALAGLGFAFTSRTAKARLVRPILSALLRRLLNSPRASVLVQNPDDLAAVGALGVARERVFLIAGFTLHNVTEGVGEETASIAIGTTLPVGATGNLNNNSV